MTHTGKCMCGAVRYEITELPSETSACHCDMCRKWSGGVYLAFQVHSENVTFKGEDNITRFPSSDWAERGFCNICGGNLFYKVTMPGPHVENYHIAFGTLDDQSRTVLTEEIFIDKKPQSYAFAGETKKMTEAEVMAMFAPAPEE